MGTRREKETRRGEENCRGEENRRGESAVGRDQPCCKEKSSEGEIGFGGATACHHSTTGSRCDPTRSSERGISVSAPHASRCLRAPTYEEKPPRCSWYRAAHISAQLSRGGAGTRTARAAAGGTGALAGVGMCVVRMCVSVVVAVAVCAVYVCMSVLRGRVIRMRHTSIDRVSLMNVYVSPGTCISEVLPA